MKMRMNLAAMSVLLGTLCFQPHACAEPQDNFWLESEWATNLTDSVWSGYYSVAFSTNGQVIIGERDVRIRVFDAGGAIVGSWASAEMDLDVATNGLIYAIVGATPSQVIAYDMIGNTIRQWPLGFDSGGIGVSRNGIVYVGDSAGNRVLAFDLLGNYLRSFGAAGNLPGQLKFPHDIAVAPSGNVYVSEYGNSRIQVFSPEGDFRRLIGAPTPIRIAVSPDEGIILWNKYYPSPGAVSVGTFNPDGQSRYAVEGGKIRIYRRGYSTTRRRPANAIPIPVVLKTEQRAGTTSVDVDFTILDPDSPNVNVAAVAFIKEQTNLASLIRMRTFEEGTGATLGTNIATGVSHHLTWNAAADWSTNFVNAQVEVLANDGRGLMDFHFLTIPIPTTLPPLIISQFPVNDGDFLNAWVWLIASGNTNVLLTNGNVKGLSGVYSGKMLTSANGTTTTADGRAFLFSLLNVRAATTDEYNRAKGSGIQWTPRLQLAGRPAKVNEFGFDTGAATANNYWVVPLP